jgi:N-acetylneuraminic acid mutarotase
MTSRIDRRRLLGAAALAGTAVFARDVQLTDARQTASPVASPAPSPWTTGVPIPEARSEMAAAVIDGRIYVPGGFYDGNRVDVFDPAAQVWHQISSLPIEVHHPGVAALNGELYVVGGYLNSGHSAVRMLWKYDAAADIWRSRAPMPQPKGALGLVAAEGALYAVGGAFRELGGPASDDLLRYDPAANRWEALAPMPTKREHLAVAAVNGRIHALGGRANGDEGDGIAGAHEVYDIASGAWTDAEPLPVPRGGLSGVAVDDTVLVLGGERGQDTYADVNRYQPATGVWDALPPMPTARHGLATAYTGGLLYAMTGSITAGTVDNTPVVEILAISDVPPPLR